MSSTLRPMSGVNFPLLLLGMCLPHLDFLTSQDQTSMLTGLAFWPSSDELEG